jgi:hypothetical protein
MKAQTIEGEKVDWSKLQAFTAESFSFKTNDLTYECKNCKYIEIKTSSGVTGYFLSGDASFSVPAKEVAGKSGAIMIRLNPKDSVKFLQIINPIQFDDKGFVSMTLLILNDTFRRCYHSGMDALIQNPVTTQWIYSVKNMETL